MAKTNNIVGQGLAPAVWYKIISMANRANTVRPYDWICYHCFKIRPPTMPSPFRRRGTAPAVDEVLELHQWQKQQYRRAGACSCRLVWNLIIGRANTVRPYDWIFYQWLKIPTRIGLHNFAATDKFPEKIFKNSHHPKMRKFPEIEGNSVENAPISHTFPHSFPQFRKSFRQVSEIIM